MGAKEAETDAGLPGSCPPASRLVRKLGTADAVLVGLGSMIGAGVFSAVGLAIRVSGNAVLLALLVAAVIATCNATSSAALAALYPESGGAYVYGRRRLGHSWGHSWGGVWGFLAGWGFVVGKIASAAAMALTFGAYVAPGLARPLALVAVVGVVAVNYFGIHKTVSATKVIVAVVLAALALCIFGALAGGTARATRLWPLDEPGLRAILRAAGLLFFAFAGYARIATLGEEVRDPARTIPRAIPAALGLTLLIYAAVIGSTLAAADGRLLASSPAPLADALRAGRFAPLAAVVRVGAAVASIGVLLSLIAGISRTIFAMAAQGDLPVWLSAVHPTHRVPHRAELVVGGAVVLLATMLNVGQAIGFSSFTVLTYYAITNAAALTLSPDERRWPRALAGLGLGGCLILACSLPLESVRSGAAVLGGGVALFALKLRVTASRR